MLAKVLPNNSCSRYVLPVCLAPSINNGLRTDCFFHAIKALSKLRCIVISRQLKLLTAYTITHFTLLRAEKCNFLHFYAPGGLIPHHTTASNNASLGSSSFRWDGVFSTTGSFTGLVSAERLEVTTANATINSAHPSMRRGSSGEMFLDAPGDIIMHIDSNNNNTDRRFRVRANTAGSADLLSVSESGHMFLSGQNNYLKMLNNQTLRHTTTHGYIELGPQNASHAHINTDRSNFYFNTGNAIMFDTSSFMFFNFPFPKTIPITTTAKSPDSCAKISDSTKTNNTADKETTFNK